LPEDSREAAEKQDGRRLRDLRACVKMARAVVSSTPGLAETLAVDWQKAARFYARFRVTEAQFRYGARDAPGDEADNPASQFGLQTTGTDEPNEGQ